MKFIASYWVVIAGLMLIGAFAVVSATSSSGYCEIRGMQKYSNHRGGYVCIDDKGFLHGRLDR